MSWNEVTIVNQRREFVDLAEHEAANISVLCRRFAISRKTGYKWIERSRRGWPDWAGPVARPREEPR